MASKSTSIFAENTLLFSGPAITRPGQITRFISVLILLTLVVKSFRPLPDWYDFIKILSTYASLVIVCMNVNCMSGVKPCIVWGFFNAILFALGGAGSLYFLYRS